MTPESIRKELRQLAEPSLRDFSSALIPGSRNLLGVRLPRLRDIARRIARDDWRSYLDHNTMEYFEERMLQGMVIGCARCPVEERLRLAAAFIPQIDNWSVCDSFCTGFRIAPAEREAVWGFIDTLLASDREFTLRTGVVLLLAHYIDEAHIDAVLDRVEALRHEPTEKPFSFWFLQSKARKQAFAKPVSVDLANAFRFFSFGECLRTFCVFGANVRES